MSNAVSGSDVRGISQYKTRTPRRDVRYGIDRRYRDAATRYLRTVIARGTTTGLLPELIGSDTLYHWAVPHGWAMSSYVQCALLLDQLTHL